VNERGSPGNNKNEAGIVDARGGSGNGGQENSIKSKKRKRKYLASDGVGK